MELPEKPLNDPVVVLVGAGLSTASGIPDYRSDTGMWKMFDPDEFTIDKFLEDPAGFWDRRIELHKKLNLMDAQPNDGHRILAKAAREGRLEHIITQNVDGLHQKAGTPEKNLIEVHGNAANCICIDCDTRIPTLDVVQGHEPGQSPRCPCGGYMKPDVVLFGEQVTELENALRAAENARTLITAGTSLQVWPVAGLAQVALEQNADLIIINRDPTPFDAHAKMRMNADVTTELAKLFGPLAPEAHNDLTSNEM